MESGPEITGPINVGNPNEFTVRELAEQVIRLTHSTSEIVEAPLPQDDPKQRQPDISKAKRDLGWEPSIQLEQGLVKTIDYFRNFVTS
jgi:UDP-glucuronate decarboxylase